MPRGSEHHSCTNTGQSGDPSDDYKPQAALEGTLFFFWAKTDMPQSLTHFFVGGGGGVCLSECGTWSHAVMSSLGARARRGVVGRLRSVSHVVRSGLRSVTRDASS